ncbi:MAG: hypothetical protein RMK65_08315, partial [Anaerolineae bacterium]|nr:hypothetical protein [Anaerolineae bacterium]
LGLRPMVGLRRPKFECQRRLTPGAKRQERLISNQRRLKSASLGLRPMVGLRRPAGERQRRLTPGAKRQKRLISNQRCVGLSGPSADGRPAPTLSLLPVFDLLPQAVHFRQGHL